MPVGTPWPFGAALTCDGQAVPAGFDGVHIFDISNVADPVLSGWSRPSAAPTPPRSPQMANGHVVVYSNVSSGCVKGGVAMANAIDIIEVPLDIPAPPTPSAEFRLRAVPSEPTTAATTPV
jgi:hypothetical protein